jgi:tetratricopeptide (TPR) repeat protein
MSTPESPLTALDPDHPLFQRGLSLMAQSLWQEAEEVFNTLLMRPPVKAKYHVMLSVIGVHTKRLEAALAHLNQALVIDPQEPMLYTQKGQLLKAMGQWELALACLQEAYTLDPNGAECVDALGEVTQHLGLWSTSLRYYDAALALNPQDAHSLNNRGNVLIKLMRWSEAIESYQAALCIDPRFALAHLNLGNALAQQHDLEGAVESFNRAIDLNPLDSVALYHRGLVLHEQKKSALALSSLNAAIDLNDQVSAYFFSKGLIDLELNCWLEAVMDFDRALALAPDQINALYNKGLALQKLGDLNAALLAHEEVVKLQNDYAEGFYSLGVIHHELKNLDLALQNYARAIALKPNYLEAYTNRGLVLKDLNDWEGAIESYQKAIELNPQFAEPYNNLGNALLQKNQIDRALWCYQQALSLQPDNRFALTNLGNLLTDLHRFDEASVCYDRALVLAPHDTDAHWNKALLLLAQGNFLEGWPLYEWRWKLSNFDSIKRHYPKPLWDGQASLQNRTILIYYEQGLGDTIQFSRFVPALKAYGARVVFEVPQALMGVLKALPGVDQWTQAGDSPPHFDTHLPLLSLPWRLGIVSLAQLRPDPYLKVPEPIIAQFSERLGTPKHPRVGLVWRGNPRHQYDDKRSCRLEDWLPFLPAGIDFISLQKEPSEEELALMKTHGGISSWSESLTDFEQTGGLIQNLDRVVSVDTSVAHLSAALGQETWLMIPKSYDWRWLHHRSDSPWYTSMRLFRPHSLTDTPYAADSPQTLEPHPWRSVFQQIESALQERR